MPRICTVCAHPARRAIETAIVSSVPNRDIAKQHGLTSSGVWRHGQAHLRPTLMKATQVAEVAHADDLLAKVRDLETSSKKLLAQGIQEGDNRVALGALAELRQLVALFAKLTGEIDDRPNVNAVILSASPEWLDVRERLFRALQPFPEARAAVVSAFGQEAVAV